MKLALIDNTDSFTYNLVQMFEEAGAEIVIVKKSEQINLTDTADGIVLSPGPGLPSDFPVMMEVIARHCLNKNILGVCLGHQALSEYFGAELYRMPFVRHGIRTKIIHNGNYIYKNIQDDIYVGRYHSWAVSEPLPDCLEVSSRTEDGVVMSFSHKEYNITGIQYHPESIITSKGAEILNNWLDSIS